MMENHPQNKLSILQIWWLAIRPRTLPASTAGVITGIGIAVLDGRFKLLPAIAALGVGLLLQITSNLANDVFDYERGTDTSERVGPMRVTQAKLLTPWQVKTGLAVVIGLAILLGLYLTLEAGWPVLLIGVAAILSAILYTGGPYPLGYHGFGDLFVFLFFGLAAVAGTYFVQAGSVSPAAWWMTVPLGLLVVNLLVVNNLRDIHTDKKAGKYTLAVRMGVKYTRMNYIIWSFIVHMMVPCLVLTKILPPIALLVLLSIPETIRLNHLVLSLEGKALNPVLAATSRLALVYGALFLLSMILYRTFPF